MATGVQMTREALCDGLDYMALQHLALMDQLIKTKLVLEENMRSGFFLMSKTRYVLGTNAVSTLQLPSEDREVDALVSVVSTPVSFEKYNGDIMYQELNTEFSDPVVVTGGCTDHEVEHLSTNIDQTDEDPMEGLRRRVVSLAEEEPSEEFSESEETQEHNQDQVKKRIINRDPIRWFSIFPPQTLRQAQSDFKTAIQLSAKCATIQGQLKAVCNEYGRLTNIKAKIENMEKES